MQHYKIRLAKLRDEHAAGAPRAEPPNHRQLAVRRLEHGGHHGRWAQSLRWCLFGHGQYPLRWRRVAYGI